MPKNYTTAEEFAANESFQDYCLNGNSKFWSQFAENNPDKEPLIDEAKMLITMLGMPQPAPIISFDKSPSKKRAPSSKAGILLSLFLLAIAAVLFYFAFSKNSAPTPVNTITHISEIENLEFILPDESHFNLRKNSTLVHKASWDNYNERELWLNGEAFFDVQKNIKPFVVHLPKGSIKVLGTKFLVKATAKKSQVILEEGNVNFEIDNNTYHLNPGDILVYDNDKLVIEKNINPDHYMAWNKTELSFKNETLSTIINTINNSFALNISLGNKKLAQRKLTASINNNDPILLLNALAEIYDIKVIKKSDKSYILK